MLTIFFIALISTNVAGKTKVCSSDTVKMTGLDSATPVKAFMKTGASINKNNWYQKVLKTPSMKWTTTTYYMTNRGKFSTYKKTFYSGSFSYYYLIDINRDGTKELLLSKNKYANTWDKSCVLLLQYYNGKIYARKAFQNLRGGIYIDKKGQITAHMGVNDLGRDWIFTVKKASVDKKMTLDYDKWAKNKYKKNGSAISQNNYMKLREQYAKYKITFKSR